MTFYALKWSLWVTVDSWYHQKQGWWWHLCTYAQRDCLEHYSCCPSTLQFSSHLNLKFPMIVRMSMFHLFQNHTTSLIPKAIPPNLIALCVEQASGKACEKPTGWPLWRIRSSLYPTVVLYPPLELYSLLWITGTDYSTQDLTSALYSSTLVKRSTQSHTDPCYRTSRTL